MLGNDAGRVHSSRYCLFVTRESIVRTALRLAVNADIVRVKCLTGPTALRMFARNTGALSSSPRLREIARYMCARALKVRTLVLRNIGKRWRFDNPRETIGSRRARVHTRARLERPLTE